MISARNNGISSVCSSCVLPQMELGFGQVLQKSFLGIKLMEDKGLIYLELDFSSRHRSAHLDSNNL